ncbi:MAG TPA: ATP-binding cassette domain-containing protein [Bacteroidales bacterium]|nr:ATP-binding cassette domain-containing protein [Bacteroidales bacterium]
MIKVLRSLPISRTKKTFLILSTVLQAILELAGLAVLVPVLLLLLEDGGIQNNAGMQENRYLRMLYDFIGVENYGTFILIVLFVVFAFIILKNFVLHKMNNYRNDSLLKIYTTYSSDLYKKYISNGLQFVKETGHTTLSHNILAVTYQFVFGYLSSALMLIADILLCLLVFVSLCFVNVYIALLEIILFTPIVLFYHYKISGKMQEAGRVDNRAKRDLWRITSETFRGFADVVVNRFLPYLQKSFDTGIRDVSRSKIRVERLKSLSSKSIEVAIMLMIVGFVAGFYFIGGGDRQFLPLIGIFAAASLKLLPSVRSILSLIGSMRNTGYTLEVLFKAETETVGKTESIGRFDTAGTSETEAVSGNAPEVATAAKEPMTFNEFIEFRHVTFGFDPGEPVLRDVSFRIQKGERVGISGPTGKGKSTLMYLLMGLYRPQTGSILIDGVPLGPENTEAWHRRIGYVSQDVFITEGTLAQNVTPYGEGDRLPTNDDSKRPKNDCGQSEEDQEQRRLANEQLLEEDQPQLEEDQPQLAEDQPQLAEDQLQLAEDQPQLAEDQGRLEDSLKTASLGDWLASLPKGIQTPIGEGGARLSGGERQRVGIARAHFKKAEILLMDEPTSALDPATEAGITGTLLQEFMNRDMTVVIISHRDSLLEQCDRIIDISEWSI